MSHHEKLDGSGYPRGLIESQISIETRIVTISDIFDALYTDRPYREGMSLEKSLSIIKDDADRGKLDPELVEQLIQMAQEGELQKIYG